jgi:hypothetical protein
MRDGIVRFSEVLRNPDSNSLQRWGNDPIYSGIFLAVDSVAVVTGVASLPSATKHLLAVLRRPGGLVAAEELAQMTRAERRASIRIAIERATRMEEDQKELLNTLKKRD